MDTLFFFLFSFISLIADGPHHHHPACGHKVSSHLSPVHALQFFLSRCKFSTLTTRQPMVEFHLLTFPRFPLRKKEHKPYFGKNRTHDFRTSRCAAYQLDHSGDEHNNTVSGIALSFEALSLSPTGQDKQLRNKSYYFLYAICLEE